MSCCDAQAQCRKQEHTCAKQRTHLLYRQVVAGFVQGLYCFCWGNIGSTCYVWCRKGTAPKTQRSSHSKSALSTALLYTNAISSQICHFICLNPSGRP